MLGSLQGTEGGRQIGWINSRSQLFRFKSEYLNHLTLHNQKRGVANESFELFQKLCGVFVIHCATIIRKRNFDCVADLRHSFLRIQI